jgi:hypothetical protein
MLIANGGLYKISIMTQKIVGIVGFIGSGKGTVGDYLVSKYGFKSESFAKSLKDAVSAIFGWPRHLCEGDTVESRTWRELPDPYWSQKVGHDITPRWVLQQMGTEVMRNNFLDNIWIWSLEKRLTDSVSPIVITDVRFPNEIAVIKNLGGTIIWVRRGPMPEWYGCAVNNPVQMPLLWKAVHPSEYMWLNHGPFVEIDNNQTLVSLYSQIDDLLV